MGGGLDINLQGGSFSQLVVIELLLDLVLLIAHVSASLGQLGVLLLMMMHNGWDLWTEFACVLRESLTKLVVDVCGWEDVQRAGCW